MTDAGTKPGQTLEQAAQPRLAPKKQSTPFNARGAYDLVFCDIDGCLGGEDNSSYRVALLGEIAAYNAASRSQRDRPRVTLCSGRPVPYVEALSRVIDNVDVPVIGENGVWMWDPLADRMVLDPQLDQRALAQVREANAWLMERYGDATVLPAQGAGPSQRESLHEQGSSLGGPSHSGPSLGVGAGRGDTSEELAHKARHGGLLVQPGKSYSLSLYNADKDVLHAIHEAMAAEVLRRGWPFRMSRTWNWINVDHLRISKGTGVQRVLDRLGVDGARAMAIGDTEGDLAMAEVVGQFAAPANAMEAVRRSANIVTSAEEIEGVLECLAGLVS